MSLENLRKALKEGKLKVGTDQTLKSLGQGKVEEVFLSSNCPEDLMKRIEKYCNLGECKFTQLKENSKELGAICKKPFSISVCFCVK
jgi:large subunit ribosomal protein L30e